MRARRRNLEDWISQSSKWRQRTQKYSRYTLQKFYDVSSGPFDWSYASAPGSKGLQVTVDENHGRIDFQSESHSGDIGGYFDSTLTGMTVYGGHAQRVLADYINTEDHLIKIIYDGPVFPCNPSIVQFPTSIASTDVDLMKKGTTAIAECKPTNNVANVATSIGEIFREGLPKLFGATLWKDKTDIARNSDEFLNLEFGWLPLLSDVRDVSYAAANADLILSQYERNAGKDVRRRYDFPVERTHVSQYLMDLNGYVPFETQGSAMPGPPAKLYRTTKTYKKTWFSGAFTYHLPTGYNSRNGMVSAAAKASHLLGLELTPEVVWNLTPWTWAIDWFSNAGDVVSNLSSWATDGLVMRYGYIMEHTRHEMNYIVVGQSRFKPGNIQPAMFTTFYETKKRRKATPFGFGGTWNGLTPRQLAISAALGISRVF